MGVRSDDDVIELAKPVGWFGPIGVALLLMSGLPVGRNLGDLRMTDILATVSLALVALLLVWFGAYRRFLTVRAGQLWVVSALPWPGRTVRVSVDLRGAPIIVEAVEVGRDDVDYRWWVRVGTTDVWCFDDSTRAEALAETLRSLGR